MITCGECYAEQYPGTLFCSECGGYLRQAATVVDIVSLPDENGITIRFMFGDRRELSCQLVTQLLLGRSDRETGIRPDVDLTLYDGVELGVSRLHALIQKSGGNVMLVDKSSTNGTFLNNYQLLPEKPHLLGQGDRVTLGSLDMIVYFE